MKSKIEIAKEQMLALINGEYDAVDFSVDFAEFCFNNYDELEKEQEGVGYYLDQEIPYICDEGEPGFDPTHMIQEIKRVYDKLIEMTDETVHFGENCYNKNK